MWLENRGEKREEGEICIYEIFVLRLDYYIYINVVLMMIFVFVFGLDYYIVNYKFTMLIARCGTTY